MMKFLQLYVLCFRTVILISVHGSLLKIPVVMKNVDDTSEFMQK